MNTPKKLILGASLLVSSACSPADNRDTHEGAQLSEAARMDEDIAEAAAHQPIQSVQDACAQEYNDCIEPVDTALAKAALAFAAHNQAAEKTSIARRSLYKYAAKEVYRNASDDFNTETLDCKRAMKSCLE